MAIKDDLVTGALLGTEHQALPEISVGGQLGELIARLSAQVPQLSRERLLLQLASLLALYQRAGKVLPVNDGDELSICEELKLPSVSAKSSRHLKSILQDNESLLAEWLAAVARAKKRVSEECLPELLEYCLKQTRLQELVSQVADSRGRWLARYNPDWNYLLARTGPALDLDNARQLWETGNVGDRCRLLASLRVTDAALARELVMSTWAEDPADQRVEFLDAFSTGLSIEDEDFLEKKALDDKRKEVRQRAVALLARIPGSGLSERMKERLFSCLVIKGMFGKNLEVSLPEACDKSMARDGINPKQFDSRMGEKAGWLCQMVGLVNPSVWRERFSCSPSELIQMAAKTEWSLPLLIGWVEAARLHRDETWVSVLVLQTDTAAAESLVQILPPDRREEVVAEYLRKNDSWQAFTGAKYDHRLLSMFQALSHTWSEQFSRLIVKSVDQLLSRDKQAVLFGAVTSRIATSLTPLLVDEVAASWQRFINENHASKSLLESALSTLSLRKEMHDALLE